jgi:hypothetical protein
MAVDASLPGIRRKRVDATAAALRALFADQQFDVLTARKLIGKKWDDRLAARIFDVNLATATAIGDRVAAALNGEFNPTLMHPWLLINAGLAATGINDSTRQSLSDAPDDAAKASVFDILTGSAAAQYAVSMVTTAANFGAHDAARASGAGTKTWIWSGRGPRHSSMAGETVHVEDQFSNGMAWPGDPGAGADEVANCGCTLQFN